MGTQLVQAEYVQSRPSEKAAIAGTERPAGACGILSAAVISAPLGALVAFTVYMLL